MTLISDNICFAEVLFLSTTLTAHFLPVALCVAKYTTEKAPLQEKN